LLQPRQTGTPQLRVNGQQVVEAGLAVRGQDGTQPTVGLLFRPLASRGDQPLQLSDPWPYYPEAEEVFAGQTQQQRGPVMFQGTVQEPPFELRQGAGRDLVEVQVTLDLAQVLGACLAPPGIVLQLVGRNVELLGHEGNDSLRSGGQVIGTEAEIAERAKLQGKPQAVGGGRVPGELGTVGLGEGEEGDQIGVDDLRREAVEPLAFGFAEEPDGHADLLL